MGPTQELVLLDLRQASETLKTDSRVGFLLPDRETKNFLNLERITLHKILYTTEQTESLPIRWACLDENQPNPLGLGYRRQ